MRWPFKYRQHPSDREGIERAKFAQSVARQIAHHADASAEDHLDIMRRNNLGPKFRKALGGR